MNIQAVNLPTPLQSHAYPAQSHANVPVKVVPAKAGTPPTEPSSTAAKVARFAVNEAVGMGTNFVVAYGFHQLVRGVGYTLGAVSDFAFSLFSSSPSQPICALNPTAQDLEQLQPIAFNATALACPNPHFPLNPIVEPSGFSSPVNVGAFAAFSLPVRQMTTYASRKVFTYIKPTPMRVAAVNFTANMAIPGLTAAVCREFGFDFDPKLVVINQVKMIFISGVFMGISIGVVAGLRALNIHLDDNEEVKTPADMPEANQSNSSDTEQSQTSQNVHENESHAEKLAVERQEQPANAGNVHSTQLNSHAIPDQRQLTKTVQIVKA